MKKLISIVLVLCIICTLCGCGIEAHTNSLTEDSDQNNYSVQVGILTKDSDDPLYFTCETFSPGNWPVINSINGISFSEVKEIWISPISEFPFDIIECCAERYYAPTPDGWGIVTCVLHEDYEGPERVIRLHIVDEEAHSQEMIYLRLSFLG